ncbi:alpha/beta hydrolase fold domain-containing protein [Corynebacterium sp. YSMAA1_1_F7]|uniref:alpha/beta hydrolase fold domain-containing protein n=1 Tax=Corynebacterium sp. YSMAA1_1_F7 TaxID=3383590 RepID=UPI0038D0C813
MSFLKRLVGRSSGTGNDATSSTPPAPAEPPHSLRQHFAVSERTEGDSNEFTVYSVAPMEFGGAGDTGDYDPHTAAIKELSPAQAATKAVLYVLPGGFVNPIKQRNWDFVAQLADAGVRVDIPLYGILPEHDHTEALPLIRRCYELLVAEHGAENITIIGDSAGGGLALAALSAPVGTPTSAPTSNEFSPETTAPNTTTPKTTAPARLILNAPWLDMDLANPRIPDFEAKDPILNPVQLRRQGALWAGDIPTEDPRVSPLHLSADQLQAAFGNSAITVYCGDRDISLPDAEEWASTVKKQGLNVTLNVARGEQHMYHLGNTRAGKAARREQIALASHI